MEAEQLIDLIRRSGLVEERRLDEFLAQYQTSAPSLLNPHSTSDRQLDDFLDQYRGAPSGKALARALVDGQVLTKWQADKLLDGRHKGFFLGHYKLLGHLATGETTSIYQAIDLTHERPVAVKVLPKNRNDDAEYLEPFLAKGKQGVALEHLHIVNTYEIGHDDNLHFIVLEYVPGGSLAQLVEKSGPLSVRRAVEVIAQTAAGLQYLDDNMLIHRDIRPETLLLDAAGRVKIVGFEHPLASDIKRAVIRGRRDEDGLNLADYMAPEQGYLDALVDHRADLYSLGCVLYFLLTGKPPFPHGKLPDRIRAQQLHKPPNIRYRRTDVPPPVVEVYERLLEKNPADRYQTAGEVHEVLSDWLATEC